MEVILFLMMVLFLVINWSSIVKIFIYMEMLSFIFILYLIIFKLNYSMIFSVLFIQVLESLILIMSLMSACCLWKLMTWSF